MSAEAKLEELGLELPPSPAPGGVYTPIVIVGKIAYLSGHGPVQSDGSLIIGRVGEDLDVEGGQAAARQTGLGLLNTMRENLGSLDKVKRVVKLLCMVNSAPDFGDQPAVANGASDFLVEVFGEKGKHARSAVGMAALPANVCIEIEMIVEVLQ